MWKWTINRQLFPLHEKCTQEIVLKYRKKDNDYDLWMKHQIKLFQGYSNLGCMSDII